MELEQLAAHAKKYGSDGIMETGIEAGLSFKKLCDLLKACDAADLARAGRYSKPPKRKHTIEQRVKRLLGIEESEES